MITAWSRDSCLGKQRENEVGCSGDVGRGRKKLEVVGEIESADVRH